MLLRARGVAGELQDCSGTQAFLHGPCQPRDGVVRLVDDHQRAVAVEQVGEGRLGPTGGQQLVVRRLRVGDGFHARHGALRPREMGLQRLVMGVDAPARRVGHAKRLDRGDDDAGGALDVLRTDRVERIDVEDPHSPAEHLVETLAVGVPRIAQRLQRLILNRLRWHEPQRQRQVAAQVGPPRNPDRLRGEQRLAAPRGQAQADVGRVGQPRERAVRARVGHAALGPRRLVLTADLVGEGVRRAGRGGAGQKAVERVERGLLVGLELHHVRAGSS